MTTDTGEILAVENAEITETGEMEIIAPEGDQGKIAEGAEGSSLRRYTAEEDDLILTMWYDKKLREKLAQQLQRPLGGLAYRFYQILKARGIEPADYRKEMRALKRSRGQGSPLELIRKLEQAAISKMAKPKKVWTTADQMNLWRWRRGGESWESIAVRLGSTPEDCEGHYQSLLKINGALEAKETAQHSCAPEPKEQAPLLAPTIRDEDLLEAMKYFPERAAQLEQRLADLEHSVQDLRERNRIDLGDLVTGLTRINEVVQERDRLQGELAEMTRRFEALREETEQEKEKIRAEREELGMVYQDLNAVLGDFMRLTSVDKLRVLGDFASRLEVTVDRFGSVVRARHTV